MQLVKKLSAKTICGNVKGLIKKLEDGATVALFRIYGIARGIKKGDTDFGAWTAFVGEFEAVDVHGEVFRGMQAFLPEIAEMLLLGPVMESDATGVKFAFDIGLRVNEALPTGYEYTVKTVIEVADNDALVAFRTELPALPAPKSKQPDLIEAAEGAAVGETTEAPKAHKAKK